MSADERSPSHPAPGAPLYFTKLSVKNVRCFGPSQELDLCDRYGRPARWTVILGENGVGKTTLLQCLFGMKPTVYPPLPGSPRGTVTNRLGMRDAEFLRSGALESASLVAEVVVGDVLNLAASAESSGLRLFEEWGPFSGSGSQLQDVELDMFCCAYGASRQPGGQRSHRIVLRARGRLCSPTVPNSSTSRNCCSRPTTHKSSVHRGLPGASSSFGRRCCACCRE